MKLQNRFLPLSILLPKVSDILEYAFIAEPVFSKILKLLPGPYTVLLKSKKNRKISKLVQAESDLIGIRSIDIEFCNELIKRLEKPIVTTSINKHGMESMTNLDDIIKNFPSIKTFYNKKNLISNGSTIIDFSTIFVKVVRQGDGIYK